MTPIASLADVWRDPGDPRWMEANETIRRVFDGVAHRHPRLQRLEQRRAAWDSEVADLFAGFWCHLAENRAALEARRVRGLGALRVEVWRYLDRAPGGGDPGEPRRRLLSHLRNEKVRPALRGDARFTQGAGTGPWMLASWNRRPPSAPPPTDAQILSVLPALPSRLEPQRPDQLPPLVDSEHLVPFLEDALERSARPRPDWELARFAWERLRPSPDGVFLLAATGEDGDDDLAGGTADASTALARERWARRVDVVASTLVDALTPRQQRIVFGYCRRVPHEALARELGVSRGTVHNEVQVFQQALSRVAEAEGLDERDARLLLEVLLHILEADGFPPERERQPA